MWVEYYHRLMVVTLVQVNSTGDFSNYTCNSNPLEAPGTHLFLVLICSRSYKKKSDFARPPLWNSVCCTSTSGGYGTLTYVSVFSTQFYYQRSKYSRTSCLIVTVHCGTIAELIQYTVIIGVRYWCSIYCN